MKNFGTFQTKLWIPRLLLRFLSNFFFLYDTSEENSFVNRKQFLSIIFRKLFMISQILCKTKEIEVRFIVEFLAKFFEIHYK